MRWADRNHRGQRLKAMRLHADPRLDPVDNTRASEGKAGILAGTAGSASGAGLGQLKLKAETLKGFQVHISNFSVSAFQAAARPRGRPDPVLRSVWLAKAGFGQINVVLDVTQHFVIDDALVAELENGLAFHLEGLVRQLLVI